MRKRPPVRRRKPAPYERPEATGTDVAILQMLKDNGPAGAQQLRNATGFSITSIVTSVRRLEELGYTEKRRAGPSVLNTITHAGRKCAEAASLESHARRSIHEIPRRP